MDYKQLDKEIEEKINPMGRIIKETTNIDNVYSSETACSPPYRNKIYGHLFTEEDELKVKIKKLEKRLNDLERNSYLNMALPMPIAQQNQIAYLSDWRLQQHMKFG